MIIKIKIKISGSVNLEKILIGAMASRLLVRSTKLNNKLNI
jgi:hypothetical protein